VLDNVLTLKSMELVMIKLMMFWRVCEAAPPRLGCAVASPCSGKCAVAPLHYSRRLMSLVELRGKYPLTAPYSHSNRRLHEG